jgi:uncharacterized repeat protein (TIGR03803 family)
MKLKALFYLILIPFLATLIPAMHAQTFSVIYTFNGQTDGGGPYAGVTIRGNALYGTASTFNVGASVYQLTHNGSNWSFSTLSGFCSYCSPSARVVFGPDGHLYGTGAGGGPYGGGTVFELTPQVGPCMDAACYWKANHLHDFGSGNDGQYPGFGDLIWDQQGNMYNTTQNGGTSGYGTAYELTPSGNGYTENVLFSFSYPTGEGPYAGLVPDKNGNLFGTTYNGGSFAGNVFELTNVPGVGWTEHILYSFQFGADGGFPVGGVIFDSAGNLYGTTNQCFSDCAGTVFELSPSGDTWTFQLLHTFSGGIYCGPTANLTMDTAGNLYGIQPCDDNGRGNVFKLTNTPNGWVYTSLHEFTGGSDGGSPSGYVSLDTDGTLYGVASAGGDMNCNGGQGCGVVWMIKP